MERLLASHIVEYLEYNSLLSDNQFGFRKGHSTENQLLPTYECISDLVDSGKLVDLLLLDFSKAFDVVCHSVLLRQLTAIGMSQQLVLWIEAFLTGGNMHVSWGGTLSSPRKVLSGVPQESVLGPLLFLIYVNSIADGILANSMAFADDFKLFKHCSE